MLAPEHRNALDGFLAVAVDDEGGNEKVSCRLFEVTKIGPRICPKFVFEIDGAWNALGTLDVEHETGGNAPLGVFGRSNATPAAHVGEAIV